MSHTLLVPRSVNVRTQSARAQVQGGHAKWDGGGQVRTGVQGSFMQPCSKAGWPLHGPGKGSSFLKRRRLHRGGPTVLKSPNPECKPRCTSRLLPCPRGRGRCTPGSRWLHGTSGSGTPARPAGERGPLWEDGVGWAALGLGGGTAPGQVAVQNRGTRAWAVWRSCGSSGSSGGKRAGEPTWRADSPLETPC